MFKKTLIVVYKDELLMNQLKKMVETHDGNGIDSINIVSWTEKVWLGNKKAGNISGKILFLGDIKGTDKLIPVVDVMFDEFGVKYGWAGNQAALFVDVKELGSRARYDAFLAKLSGLPVPDRLKTLKSDAVQEEAIASNTVELEDGDVTGERKTPAIVDAAKRGLGTGANIIGKAGSRIAGKAEEVFRNRKLMRRQMLFYGVVKLYDQGLESFMNG